VGASSLMFGIFHIDPARMVTTGCIGVVLGLLVLRSGSLWTGVIAHTLNNGVAIGMAMGGVAWTSRPGTPLDGAVWAGLTAVCVCAVVAARGHRDNVTSAA